MAAITLLKNEGIPIERSSYLANKNILDQHETKQKWYGAQSVVATSLAREVARRRAQWSKVNFYRKKASEQLNQILVVCKFASKGMHNNEANFEPSNANERIFPL